MREPSWYSKGYVTLMAQMRRFLPGNRAVLMGIVLLSACSEETVVHQQPEREANRILSKLRTSSIDAKKVRDEESRDVRFNIVVPSPSANSAYQVLEDNNLPETERAGTERLFSEGGMIPTRQQEMAKRIAGIENDVINSLRQLPRVIDVKVAVSIPESDPLRDPTEIRPRPKAAVLVIYQPQGLEKPPVPTEDVQRFVQAKLPELRPNEVGVTFLPSEALPDDEVLNADGTAAVIGRDPKNSCEKAKVLGVEVCTGERKRMLNYLILMMVSVGLASVLAVLAILRALRYRKDLTRLTAQFENAQV